jgi:hypothetical protein
MGGFPNRNYNISKRLDSCQLSNQKFSAPRYKLHAPPGRVGTRSFPLNIEGREGAINSVCFWEKVSCHEIGFELTCSATLKAAVQDGVSTASFGMLRTLSFSKCRVNPCLPAGRRSRPPVPGRVGPGRAGRAGRISPGIHIVESKGREREILFGLLFYL